MVYIYDILVNFNDSYLYDFFEWNLNDEIENIKKVKLYRVSTNCINDFIKNKVKVPISFLGEIYKTCEVYTKNSVKQLYYVTLFSDGKQVLAIEWDNKGYSICKSKLIVEEEEDVIELAQDMEIYSLDYEIIKKEDNRYFLTRKELKIRKYLTLEIEDAYKKKKHEKLKFMYEEYFEKKSNNYLSMKEELISSMKTFLDNKHFSLYELLRLSHKKKKV